MTKKYWKNWQQRVNETKNIYKFWFYQNGHRRKSYNGVLDELNGDILAKATFRGDEVDLVIERHRTVIDWKTRSLKQNVENEYVTLHREDIARIEFKRNN